MFFGQSGFEYRLLQTLGTYNAATAVKDGTVKTGTAVKNTTVNAGSAVKTGTLNTASAVKNTTTNATTAVSSSFFGVVEMARKVILISHFLGFIYHFQYFHDCIHYLE